MAASKFILLPLLALAACAPSPLYVSSSGAIGTVGEIPRDGRGEPLWSAIVTPEPVPAPPPGLTVNPGIPITPPPGY